MSTKTHDIILATLVMLVGLVGIWHNYVKEQSTGIAISIFFASIGMYLVVAGLYKRK